MRRLFPSLLTVLACVAAAPVVAQPTVTSPASRQAAQGTPGTMSSFVEVAQRALRSHPDVAARRHAWEAQREVVAAARAGWRARVDVYAGAGTERAATLDAVGGIRHASGPSRRATVSLRQPLYDGSEVASEVERQSRIGNARYHELREAEDALLGELAAAWVDVVRQRALIETARENVAAHERLLALVEARVRSGVSRGVDLEQARARVAAARLAVSSDQGALAEALARFQRAANERPADVLVPIAVPTAQQPSGEADALARALEHSPAVRGAAENEAAVVAELALRRAAYAPRVALEARHDLSARGALQSDTAYSSLLLTLNYNLYAGGGDAARERDAALRREQARAQLGESKLVARQLAATAWSDARRQAGVYENASGYVQSLRNTRDAYRVQFDIGQRSLLDLLNTENEVTQARRLQLNSWADLQRAQLRLLLLTGRFVDAFSLVATAAEPLVAPPADRGDLTELLAHAETARRAGLDRTASGAATPSVEVASAVPASPVAVAAATGGELAGGAARSVPRARRPAVVAGRIEVAPVAEPVLDVDARLPQPVWLGLLGWRDALREGHVEAISHWYAGDAAREQAAAWRALPGDAGLASGTAPLTVRLLRAERTDDERTVDGAQLMLVAVVGDGDRQVCVRSAQAWRNEAGSGAPARWRIVRERASSADAAVCAR